MAEDPARPAPTDQASYNRDVEAARASIRPQYDVLEEYNSGRTSYGDLPILVMDTFESTLVATLQELAGRSPLLAAVKVEKVEFLPASAAWGELPATQLTFSVLRTFQGEIKESEVVQVTTLGGPFREGLVGMVYAVLPQTPRLFVGDTLTVALMRHPEEPERWIQKDAVGWLLLAKDGTIAPGENADQLGVSGLTLDQFDARVKEAQAAAAP